MLRDSSTFYAFCESVKCYWCLVRIFSMLNCCFEPTFIVFTQRSLDIVQSLHKPVCVQQRVSWTETAFRFFCAVKHWHRFYTVTTNMFFFYYFFYIWIHRHGCRFLCLWATYIWEVEGQRNITSVFDTSIKGFMVFLLMACSISMTASSFAVSGSERSS